MSRLWFGIIFVNFCFIISFEAIKPPFPSYTDILISKLKRPAFFQRILSDSQNLQSDESYALPNRVQPKRYNLRIKTDIEENVFEGSVDIEIEILNFTSEIVLHSHELNIECVKLFESDRKMSVGLENSTFDIERNFILLTVSRVLIPNDVYLLRIEFNGEMRDVEKGLFKSFYLNENKEKRWNIFLLESTKKYYNN